MEVALSSSVFVVFWARLARWLSISSLAAMLWLACSSASQAATQPGPDAFGYTVARTSAYAFTNITNSATRVLFQADDAAVTANIGFVFNFYGSNYTTVGISLNGMLTFGGLSTNYVNTNLTTVAVQPNLPTIAVYWDDWQSQDVDRGVFYRTEGPVGSRQFIVQWEQVVSAESVGFDTVTFEARLFEGNNTILMSYPDVVITDEPDPDLYSRGRSQTVGIRDRDGQTNNRNLLWSHNTAGSVTNRLHILYTRPNHPPIAVDDSVLSSEDIPAIIDVVSNDSDPDGNILIVTAVTQGTNGTVSITSSNTVRYAPVLDFRGDDHFTYTISDGQGGSATGMVAVTVIDQNDPPVGRADSYRVLEDTLLAIPAPGVLTNDTDPESTALSAVLVTGPSHGSLTLNQDGSFNYLSSSNYFGSDSFVYRANDGNLVSSNTSVTIMVDPVNDPPVALGATASTIEDTPVNVRLRGTDPDGDTLNFSLLTAPSHGSLTGTPPDLRYSPATNFYGADVFTFMVNDGHATQSSTGTVFITVSPVNEYSPVAVDDNVRATRNTTLVITNDTLVFNDTDGDLYDRLVITGVSPTSTAGGSLVLGLDTVTYTPPTNYLGADSFTYVVSDGQGGAPATGTVHVAVSIRLVITGIAPTSSNSMVLTFEAPAGGVYNVEGSSNFTDWSMLGAGTQASAGIFRFHDDQATTLPRRFYRLTAP